MATRVPALIQPVDPRRAAKFNLWNVLSLSQISIIQTGYHHHHSCATEQLIFKIFIHSNHLSWYRPIDDYKISINSRKHALHKI